MRATELVETERPAGERIAHLVEQCRIVEPNETNALRLWNAYQRRYRSDRELFERIVTDSGIDGLTEPLSSAEVFEELRLPCSETFAWRDADDNASYVQCLYCTAESNSRASFKERFLTHVFDESRLQFDSPVGKSAVEQALAEGNAYYVGDFVGAGGPLVSTALMFALHQELAVRRMRLEDCVVFGKCLVGARLGDLEESRGNRPVLALAKRMGLTCLATQEQSRTLELPDVEPSRQAVTLRFGLFLGTSRRLTDSWRRWNASA